MAYYNNSNNKPSHTVYSIREVNKDQKDQWNKIGVAFAHNDSKGFSIRLEALPLDGKLTLRQYEPKPRS